MGDGFRGVSADQDGRFKIAEKKLMAKMKFPPEFSQKIDLSKVRQMLEFQLCFSQNFNAKK